MKKQDIKLGQEYAIRIGHASYRKVRRGRVLCDGARSESTGYYGRRRKRGWWVQLLDTETGEPVAKPKPFAFGPEYSRYSEEERAWFYESRHILRPWTEQIEINKVRAAAEAKRQAAARQRRADADALEARWLRVLQATDAREAGVNIHLGGEVRLKPAVALQVLEALEAVL
jgi:hypothetical protein